MLARRMLVLAPCGRRALAPSFRRPSSSSSSSSSASGPSPKPLTVHQQQAQRRPRTASEVADKTFTADALQRAVKHSTSSPPPARGSRAPPPPAWRRPAGATPTRPKPGGLAALLTEKRKAVGGVWDADAQAIAAFNEVPVPSSPRGGPRRGSDTRRPREEEPSSRAPVARQRRSVPMQEGLEGPAPVPSSTPRSVPRSPRAMAPKTRDSLPSSSSSRKPAQESQQATRAPAPPATIDTSVVGVSVGVSGNQKPFVYLPPIHLSSLLAPVTSPTHGGGRVSDEDVPLPQRLQDRREAQGDYSRFLPAESERGVEVREGGQAGTEFAKAVLGHNRSIGLPAREKMVKILEQALR